MFSSGTPSIEKPCRHVNSKTMNKRERAYYENTVENITIVKRWTRFDSIPGRTWKLYYGRSKSWSVIRQSCYKSDLKIGPRDDSVCICVRRYTNT